MINAGGASTKTLCASKKYSTYIALFATKINNNHRILSSGDDNFQEQVQFRINKNKPVSAFLHNRILTSSLKRVVFFRP
jgi:hypothetical protein